MENKIEKKLKVVIDPELCKGCELCVAACPCQVLAISKTVVNSRGNYIAKVVNNEQCTSCRACYIVCPDIAIEVYK